jgi:UDP-glucose 4-epimerase
MDGRIVLFGKGEERRSHLYIDDAIELIRRSVLRRSEGSLNLAVRPAVSYLSVATLVSKNCGKPVIIEFTPRTIKAVHRPYKATQVFRFIYNLGRRIGPIVHRPYAVSAIFHAFPDFQYTPLEHGLQRYIASLKRDLSGELAKP